MLHLLSLFLSQFLSLSTSVYSFRFALSPVRALVKCTSSANLWPQKRWPRWPQQPQQAKAAAAAEGDRKAPARGQHMVTHAHTQTNKLTNKQIDTEVGFRGEWEGRQQSIEMFNEFFTFNCLALHSLLLHSRSCCCCCLFFWHSRCCGALCNRQSHAHVHAHAQWDTHHMQAALAAAEPWQRPQQRRRVYLYCV